MLSFGSQPMSDNFFNSSFELTCAYGSPIRDHISKKDQDEIKSCNDLTILFDHQKRNQRKTKNLHSPLQDKLIALSICQNPNEYPHLNSIEKNKREYEITIMGDNHPDLIPPSPSEKKWIESRHYLNQRGLQRSQSDDTNYTNNSASTPAYLLDSYDSYSPILQRWVSAPSPTSHQSLDHDITQNSMDIIDLDIIQWNRTISHHENRIPTQSFSQFHNANNISPKTMNLLISQLTPTTNNSDIDSNERTLLIHNNSRTYYDSLSDHFELNRPLTRNNSEENIKNINFQTLHQNEYENQNSIPNTMKNQPKRSYYVCAAISMVIGLGMYVTSILINK
jgi:hypothetical protein